MIRIALTAALILTALPAAADGIGAVASRTLASTSCLAGLPTAPDSKAADAKAAASFPRGLTHARAQSVPPTVLSSSGMLHRVPVRVAPYGDVYVNGKQVATATTQTSVLLPAGDYEVVFRNPYAKTQRISLRVPLADANGVMARLQPRPARVVLRTNVDAEVRLGGRVIGRTWSSEKTPIALAMPDWRGHGRYPLELVRDGYRPQTVHVDLRAGADVDQTVTLVRSSDAAQPPIDPAPSVDRLTLDNIGISSF